MVICRTSRGGLAELPPGPSPGEDWALFWLWAKSQSAVTPTTTSEIERGRALERKRDGDFIRKVGRLFFGERPSSAAARKRRPLQPAASCLLESIYP